MGQYRVFVLDGQDHIKESPRIVECQDDELAISEAKQWLDGHVIEVWSGPRRVARLDPKSSGYPSSSGEPFTENPQ